MLKENKKQATPCAFSFIVSSVVKITILFNLKSKRVKIILSKHEMSIYRHKK
jgi:hypothetical protein